MIQLIELQSVIQQAELFSRFGKNIVNPKEINTLKIIEILEAENAYSQRELSKKLNISLGLVNLLIQSSIKKGIFEINTLTKNKTKYLLTPKGKTVKSILTYRYIEHSIKHYNYIRSKLQILIAALSEDKKKNIAFFGANELVEIASIILQDYKLNLSAIIDDDKAGKMMTSMTIETASFLGKINFDALIITQLDSAKLIIDKVLRQGVNQNKIYTI